MPNADPGTGVPGTIYCLHIEPPLGHAKHYLGWTGGAVEDRLADHRAGRGARLTAGAVRAGCKLVVAWTKPGDRNEERRLKRCKCTPRDCPQCKAERAKKGS